MNFFWLFGPTRCLDATEETFVHSRRKEEPAMKRTALTTAAGLAGAGLALGSLSPAAADPKPNNDSSQT